MSRISGETRLLAVAGHPIAHSLSPLIHNFFAAGLGADYAYLAFDVRPETLAAFADAARLLPMAGFNLTMPLKTHILPLLDECSEEARACGSVNTVAVRGGCLYGYNTDGPGFLRSLARYGGFCPDGKVMILGSGGAARALSEALSRSGAEVVIISRRPEAQPPRGPVIHYAGWDRLRAEAAGCSLLVNATPLGMRGFPDDFADFSFLDGLPSSAIVYDLIYHPPETALLKAARARGLRAVNGLPHLVCQAALAFEHFTGFSPTGSMISDVLNAIK